MKPKTNHGSSPSTTTQPFGLSVPVFTNRRLLSVQETAIYLGISTWRVRGLIHREVLKPVRIPLGDGREERRFLLDVVDLDTLIAMWKDS